MRILAAVLLVAAFAAPAPAAEGPPLTGGWYVDAGACPFEGCAYRDWTVAADTALFDRPRGSTVVALAAKGRTVRAETGAVYTRPIPVTVAAPHRLESYSYTDGRTYVRELRPGERFYLLTYEGEGFNIAWLDGRRLSVSIVAMHDRSVHRFASCETPAPDCWWTIPEDNRERQAEWWVRIRLADGTTGWTTEVRNFHGISAYD